MDTKKRFILLLKILFAILPFVWIVSKIDIMETKKLFLSLPIWVIPSVTVVLFFRVWLQSFRFQYLTRIYTNSIKVSTVFFLDMKARYYSIVIPSSVGQDIVRGTMLKKYLSTDQILSVSLFFRISAVIPFLLFSIYGFFKLSNEQAFQQYKLFLLIIIIFFITSIILLFSKKVRSKANDILINKLPNKYYDFIRDTVIAFHSYKNNPSIIWKNFIITLITQSLVVLSSLISIKGITGNWYLIEVITFVPLIELMAIVVPFAPNGIGVRELMSILFFSILGRSSDETLIFISVGLIGQFINLSGVLPVLVEKIYLSYKYKI